MNGKTCLPKDIIKDNTLVEVMIDEPESLDIEAQNLPENIDEKTKNTI